MGYVLTVLIGIDQLGSAVFFGRNDITISALCGLALEGKPDILGFPLWKMKTLRVLGRILNKIQKGHCLSAIKSDKARATSTLAILS